MAIRNRRTSYVLLMTIVTSSTLFLSGCGLNLFTVEQDVQLGREMDAEIQAHPDEYPILRNEEIRSYVQGVVNTIIESPAVRYRGRFPYTVTIINDDRTVNAFATPGGYIYVYTGLLKYLDSEAALAGVLAHEIAHSEERHGTEHMSQALGADVALSIALGNNPSELAQTVGNSAALLAMLGNSREDESEADAQGFKYLQSSPYWPGAIKLFFEKMLREKGTTGDKLREWTSTHPLPETRVEDINALLRAAGSPPPTPNSLMAERYKAMMRKLR